MRADFLFLLSLAASGCGKAASQDGCTKDTDCKAERVCTAGRCLEPQAPTATAPLANRPTPPDPPPRRDSTAEALLQLNKLGKNLKIIYNTTSSFPEGKVGPSPSLACCSQPNKRCQSNASHWASPIWQALDYRVDGEHQFQYSYESDGKTVTARAVGDPTCSGRVLTYTLKGSAPGGNASMSKRCVNPTWLRRARPPRLPRCESHPSEAS